MKRRIALLLALLLLTGLLAGCAGGEENAPGPGTSESPAPSPEPTPEPAAEPTPEPSPTPEPTPEPDRSLTWARAFADASLPEGSLEPGEIAFYRMDDEGNPEIVNVPREEVQDWWDAQETLPRTHYFEQFMPERLHALYPILDYAFAHSYSRFCVPTTEFTATDVGTGSQYLRLTYRINNRGISTLTPASFDLGGGKTLQYVTVTLRGMEQQGVMSQYQQSLAAAREVVAGIPEGSSEYEKALYLYRWLTDNVVYDYNDYYGSEWNLLYDTMVRKKTVCAGYTEALYVMYNLAGIECFTIWGSIYDGEWTSHIWNVAKVDGEYYLFDSTWDAGRSSSEYCFFGVSMASMQMYYPRQVDKTSSEYCPPCENDLPLPAGEGQAETLRPGTLVDGVYRQPYWGLSLYVDESWQVSSREEIAEWAYGDPSLAQMDVNRILRMGWPYLDLMLNGDGASVQIVIEKVPVATSNNEVCETPEAYMDNLALTLPVLFEEQGMPGAVSSRFQVEICGRNYECMQLSLQMGRSCMTQLFCCARQGDCFLSVIVMVDLGSENEAQELLRQLLEGPGEE